MSGHYQRIPEVRTDPAGNRTNTGRFLVFDEAGNQVDPVTFSRMDAPVTEPVTDAVLPEAPSPEPVAEVFTPTPQTHQIVGEP